MRAFILGASGYAGFYAALRLAACGHTVVGLVRNPAQPRLNILRMREVMLVSGDASKPETYRDELQRSDVVIHAMLDKKNLRETDRTLFKTLQETAPSNGKRRRLIYTTGCSIFGPLPGVHEIDEHTEPNPEHPLSFRRELEREALAIPGVATTVLRPGFMFGNDGYNSVASDWFEMAANGDPVFRGDRERGWSWIHIDDLAEAYRLVVDADRGVEDEIFCLADELRPKCVDVMRACLEAAGYAGELPFEGPKKGDNISTWFNQNEFVSSAKARRVLGWSTRHPGILQAAPAAYASWKAAQG
jgi:nucleoside-diphosphate-sugar epimerase